MYECEKLGARQREDITDKFQVQRRVGKRKHGAVL
jgi:hypothetical protein